MRQKVYTLETGSAVLNTDVQIEFTIDDLSGPSFYSVNTMDDVSGEWTLASDEDYSAVEAEFNAGEYDEKCWSVYNDDMSESYIMVDPLGRFFQNTAGQKGYHYSNPIDVIGAERAFIEWRFSAGTYAARYRGALVVGRE